MVRIDIVFAVLLAIAAGSVSVVAASGDGPNPKERLAGRTLSVMVGFSNTGGGARFWNAFSGELRDKLPETIIRARFNDAGSGVDGTSDLYKLSEGSLAIGFVRPPEIAFAQLNERADADFDFRSAQWIAGVEQDSFIMAARRDLPKDPQVLRKQQSQTILPVSDILATHATVGILLNAVTGVNSKIVVGFKKSDRKRAILAGDVDLYTIAADASLAPLLESGDIEALYTITGNAFPPEMGETQPLEDYLVSDAPLGVVEFIKSARGMGRAFFAPPSVSPEDVAVLRTVFAEMLEDPDFIKRATAKGVPVSAVPGETVAAQLNALLISDAELKAQIEKAYDCGLAMSRGEIPHCEFRSE